MGLHGLCMVCASSEADSLAGRGTWRPTHSSATSSLSTSSSCHFDTAYHHHQPPPSHLHSINHTHHSSPITLLLFPLSPFDVPTLDINRPPRSKSHPTVSRTLNMPDPMDTDQPPLPIPIEQSLEGVLFPTSTSTPPPNNNPRQISRLSHPPPPIDSPVLSAAHTPSKPASPLPNISMNNMKEDTPTVTATTAGTTTSSGLLSANGKMGNVGVITGDGKGAGAPVRQYLNEFVTPYLLEGMRIIARDQPANPLEALGRYLIQQSQLHETTSYSGGQQQQQHEGGTPRAEVKMEEAA
ncbi:COMPASS (complex proteins associated with Set1p) component [Orbilia oligospora]|nr:COMPASS (complex proteins associated with Set1p) component [Orbilia oligospora]